jgi:hypothetical protein
MAIVMSIAFLFKTLLLHFMLSSFSTNKFVVVCQFEAKPNSSLDISLL